MLLSRMLEQNAQSLESLMSALETLINQAYNDAAFDVTVYNSVRAVVGRYAVDSLESATYLAAKITPRDGACVASERATGIAHIIPVNRLII